MADLPRTKFNSPWTVAVIEAALNDVSSAKGSSESLTAALNAMRAEINSLSGGVHLKGAVDYYADLPVSPSEGDAYTVRYQGTSGTDPLGIEYAWATYQGTPQWIPIGVDPSVFAKQDEMNVVASMGAVSIVPVTAVSSTAGGVEYTVNDDGTVVANRTASSSSSTWFRLNSAVSLKKGTYTLSGGKSANERVLLSPTTTLSDAIADSQGSEVTFTLDSDTDNLIYAIRIAYTDSPSNVKFYPMIKPAEITDPTFQPYAKTNRELTVLTDEDRNALVEQVDEGAKNFVQLGFTSTSGSSSVPATTNNNDGTITVNGSRVGNATILIQDLITAQTSSVNTRYTLPAGNYVIAPTGNSNIGLQVYKHDGTNLVSLGNARIEALSFTYSDTDKVQYPYICIRLFCEGNSTINNFTFMPMVCTKAAWDVSQKFVPYCPTNRELYERNNVIDISSAVTAETGYTVESSTHLYYQNKQVFGTIAIAINSGSYPSSLTIIAKLPVEYAPARQHLGSCGFSTNQWAITNIGYAFIQAANASSTAQRGQISVKSPTENLTHMILNVCYPVQIDGTL